MKALLTHPDELDVGADDLAAMDEVEYEESESVEIAAELELLLDRVQVGRFSGA
jgi:hypothetical protein